MAAKVFCMASSKGGSGKTVLTATFGTFLAGVGKRVLLIDTDAATNGLTLLYLKEVLLQGEYAIGEKREPRGIYEGIRESTPAEIVKLMSGPHLIPATYEFKNTEQMSVDTYHQSLLSAIFLSRDSYDYIFLDAQAGSDVYAQIAMSRKVSDEVVIVSEYDPMSAAGVERLKGFLREDLTYVRTWVLLNKMLPDFIQSFSDFLEVAKYLSPIPWDADVVRAYARRRLALDLEQGNEYTLAILQSLRSLIGDEISEEISEWMRQRATLIREPIEEQYKDTVKQLEELISNKFSIKQKLEHSRFQRNIFVLVSIMTLFGFMAYMFMFSEGLTSRLIFVGVGALLIPIMYFAFSVLFGKPSLEKEVEQFHIERRVSTLEEKLKKLEVLRSADLETLIKDGKRI